MNLDELYSKAKENPETGCIEWQMSRSRDGYGQARYHGKQQGTHRIAYMIYHSTTLKSNEYICHTCDNRKCINVHHLFLGDALANNLDTIKKHRQVFHYGEDHKDAKLTNEKVLEMRKRNSRGESIRSLSREFGVAFETAREAIHGKTWKI